MNAAAPTVLGIVGSLRRDSLNGLLVSRAEALVGEGVAFDTFAELGSIPHFNEDTEGELTPPAVGELRERIGRAGAIVIATPEYNSAMPGALKNALDWASRPPGESILADKPAAVIGASPGRFGAQRAQADVRRVLTAIGAEVLEDELPVARAHEAFDEHGALRDEELDRRLAALLSSLVELAGVPVTEEQAALAAYSLACQRLAATS
jgi:chromate reductase